MRFIVAILLSSIYIHVSAQVERLVSFEDGVVGDTLTTHAEPIGGYKQLLKHLELKINGSDSAGKKFSLHLYNVRFKVNANGIVDSTYIAVNHSACPVHEKIAAELRNTKWHAATNRGKPVQSYEELHGSIQVNKNVLKKCDCWPSFIDRFLFGLH